MSHSQPWAVGRDGVGGKNEQMGACGRSAL